MRLTYWEKTDNSGMIYPLILTLSAQSNFEFCITLSEMVDPEILRQALVNAYERFSYAKVELQNNFFRSCFVENNAKVVVHKNNGKILGRINFVKNNNYLVEVSFVDREVHLKIFHSLSDGTGAFVFVKYLLIEYARLKGIEVQNDNPVELEGEHENAYDKYIDKTVGRKGLLSDAKAPALQIKGKFFRTDGLGLIIGDIPLEKIHALSKQYGCSITVFIGAVVIETIKELYGNKKKKPSLFFPVNLRRFFPSNTLLNFVTSAKCVLSARDMSLEETIAELKDVLKDRLSEINLKRALLLASTIANNPVTRFCPFFLKRQLITFGRELTTQGTQTMIISNLGEFVLPEEIKPMVDGINFYLNCNRRTPVNMSVSSYNGTLSVCFTRHIIERKVEKLFFEKMRALGLDFEIRSNYREVQYGL